MRFIAGIIALVLALSLAIAGRAQLLELSCTASQQVAIQSRLDSLPTGQRQRFEAQASEFDQEMHQHHGEARALEEKSQRILDATLTANPDIRDRLLKAAFEKRPELAEKYRDAVLSEQPDLVEQARQGDSDALGRLNALILQRVSQDPIFIQEFNQQVAEDAVLQRRLLDNPEGRTLQAQKVRLQQKLNEDEKDMAGFLYRIPTPEGEQRTTEAARSVAAQTRVDPEAVTKTPAMRALLVTAYYAGQMGVAGGEIEPAAKYFAMQKFDTPATQEADLDLGAVVPAVETARNAMTQVAVTKLEVSLGLTQQHLQLPKADLRPSVMKDTKNVYARAAAETTAQLLNKQERTYRASQLLKDIKLPPPPAPEPPAPDTPKETAWVKEVVTKVAPRLEETGKKVIKIIMVSSPEQ